MTSKFITGNVQIKDNGYNRIMREMVHGKRMELYVGILDEAGSAVHPRTGKTVREYAYLNEMGEPGVPSRSMIRAWVDKNVKRMQSELLRAYGKVVRSKMSRATEKAELKRIGEKYVRQVQSRIERKRIPPVKNKPWTIKRKGFDHPLIETELMLKSFSHKVVG